jgi:hypothetical protein
MIIIRSVGKTIINHPQVHHSQWMVYGIALTTLYYIILHYTIFHLHAFTYDTIVNHYSSLNLNPA